MPKMLSMVYDKMLFWFDTLGLAAFTVDGVMVGIRKGDEDNVFLLVFLGFLTAVGGGTLEETTEQTLTPAFSGDTMSYSTPILDYVEDSTSRFVWVATRATG